MGTVAPRLPSPSTQVLLSPEFKALLVKAVERTREAHPDKARVLLEKIFRLARAIEQQRLREEGEAGEREQQVEFRGITLVEGDEKHPDSVLVHM